jgi:glucose-6-phosphate 1-epimerase
MPLPSDLAALPPFLRLDSTSRALPAFEFDSPTATATLFSHGAHLAAWAPKGESPVLFLSRQSHFTPGKPIRGGVPVCFPWFAAREGRPDSPAHGFLRTAAWRCDLLSTSTDGTLHAELCTSANAETRLLWPFDFHARLHLAAGAALAIALEITNSGPQPFTFEEALHTYLAVGDARAISLHGLENTVYIDKVDAGLQKTQDSAPITLTGETDRVYQNTTATVSLCDPHWRRTLRIEKTGSRTTVVWNPWITKAKVIADFGDEEWPDMVCIETANTGENAITLEPGAVHSMLVRIAVEPRHEPAPSRR